MKFKESTTIIFFLLLVFFCTGCTYHNVQLLGNLNQSEKNITTPPGNRLLKGKIKAALTANGWDVRVHQGESTTTGCETPDKVLLSHKKYNTRYLLYIDDYQYDIYIDGNPAIKYELSLIDNKTQKEILTMDGKGYIHDAVKKFCQSLSELQTVNN